jgi:hypothetical protein
MHTQGISAIGKALTAECPRCLVQAGQPCQDKPGELRTAPHVERGRAARWAVQASQAEQLQGI